MRLSEHAVRGDLEALFPEIFDDPVHLPYLKDYIRIGVFLSAPDGDLMAALATLESRMQQRLFKNLGFTETKWSSWVNEKRRAHQLKAAQKQFNTSIDRFHAKAAMQPVKKNAAFSKLLTSELAEKEQALKFNLFADEHGHPKPEMILPLKADQFRQQLAARRPFKDPTIGPDHGEYTHRLQWYVIAEAGILSNPPATVYEFIGYVPWHGSKLTALTKTSDGAASFGLWDALCDRQPPGAKGLPTPFPFYKKDDMDFRCPEALLTWLCQPAQQHRYPLLAPFLRARKEKRSYVRDNDSNKNPLLSDYFALKVFHKPFMLLTEKEQGEIDGLLAGGLQQGVLTPRADQAGYQKVS